MAKTNKFNVPNGLVSQGKTCLEKLKTLLKFLDGTTSLILRSSKRWSMAAAISVGIDETDELMTDEDTLAGKQHSDLFMNSVHCIGNTSPITPFKMGMALDFETCGYGDSMGGTGLMGITPRMIVFKIPRERLKKSTF